uniref:Uncharacterized protein n=1 Tax=Caenorhabditis japonica TaxID=281687 RepID=A0A8R1EMP7_CAEJA
MWRAFDEEAERSDRYTRTAYFAEEFRSLSGSSTKKKRNAFQMCGQSEFVHYDDGVQRGKEAGKERRIVNSSIGRAFQNLRSYHYDIALFGSVSGARRVQSAPAMGLR